MRAERDPFYLTPAWKRKARQIMIRDRYQCQISKRYGKLKPAELVHHVFPREEFPEYTFADWNLIAVSQSIHAKLHNDHGELTEMGRELLRQVARRNGITVPDEYVKRKTKTRSFSREILY